MSLTYSFSQRHGLSRAQRSGRGLPLDYPSSDDDDQALRASKKHQASQARARMRTTKKSQQTRASKKETQLRRVPHAPRGNVVDEPEGGIGHEAGRGKGEGADSPQLDMAEVQNYVTQADQGDSIANQSNIRPARPRQAPMCICCDGPHHEASGPAKATISHTSMVRKDTLSVPSSMPGPARQTETTNQAILRSAGDTPDTADTKWRRTELKSFPSGPSSSLPFKPQHQRRKRFLDFPDSDSDDSEAEEQGRLDEEEGDEQDPVLDVTLDETYVSENEGERARPLPSQSSQEGSLPKLADLHFSTPPTSSNSSSSDSSIRTPNCTPPSPSLARFPTLLDDFGDDAQCFLQDDDNDLGLLDMDDHIEHPYSYTDQSNANCVAPGSLANIPLFGADSDEDSDDGDMLKRLMQRAQGLQAGAIYRQAGSETEREAQGDWGDMDIILEDEEEMFGFTLPRESMDGADRQEDRRERALSFLESLCFDILSQLDTSLRQVNAYHAKKLKAATESKKKAKMLNDVSSDEEEKVEKEEEVDWDMVGIQLSLMNRRTGNSQVMSFPGDLSLPGRVLGQRRLACILRVAELLYASILDQVVCTKRDIYYHDVALFGNQRVVDALVDDIAASANLKRQDFYVCAASKGLIVATNLSITLRSGEVMAVSPSNTSLIPPIERIADISTSIDDDGAETRGIDWVLIVEKDAVFQTLCSAGLMRRDDIGTGVLITGKGYPDLATLQLVSRIAAQYPEARIHALVDADPHGLDILSVYRYGSAATRHSADYRYLHLGDRIEWMGIKASEWMSLGVRYEDLLSLSDRDVKKAQAMLRDRPHMPVSWRRELAHMLHLNKKAEIQILSSIPVQDYHDDDLDGGMSFGAEKEGGWAGYGQIGRGGGLMGYVLGKLLTPP